MKELKTYAHLYLGCQITRNDLTGKLSEIDIDNNLATMKFSDEIGQNISVPVDEIKLILRPLSDMTNVEGRHIYKNYFGLSVAEDFSGDTGSAYFRPKQITPNKTHGLRIVEGEDYSTGDFMTVAGLMPYLLSRGFDLFGLIDAGLAVSKTESI